MALFHKYAKLLCNGFLLVLLGLVVGLFLLNCLNPRIPSLRCDGPNLLEPSISHKSNGDTVTTLRLFTAVLAVPVIQILITEWFWNRKDANAYMFKSNESSSWKRISLAASAVIRDYLVGLFAVVLINDIAKTTLNAPRPHWLDTCKPNFTKEACVQGWLTDYECTNTQISDWKLADGRKSFPSGHAATSFYAAVFMTIYQNRRVNRRYVGTIFLLWLHLIWIGFAIFCALSRVADNRHHPIDIAFGGIIGAFGGILSVQFLCGCFGRRRPGGSSYQNKINSCSSGPSSNGSNGVVDGYPSSPPPTLPPGLNGGTNYQRSNGDKRHSLKRLLSTQSNVTQMSDIVEDRELDSL